MINIQIHLLRNSKGQLVTIYKIVSFFVCFFQTGKHKLFIFSFTRKFTFSSVSNQRQHSGFLHLDDVFLPEGEPFRLLLVHEDGLVNGGGKFRVERLRQVVAGGGSDHGSDSQPEVGT